MELELGQIAPREPDPALDPHAVDAGRRLGRDVVDHLDPDLVPGEEAREPLGQQRHHLLGGRSTSSSSGLGIAARPATPSTTRLKCSRQTQVGGLAIGGQARRPPVELDGRVVEVARADRRQHARRGRERVAGVAQEDLDRVVARHQRP